jgi:SAM-dependent methyltransferase
MTQPEKVNFDEYAEDYDNILENQLSFFGEENSYFAEYKVQIVRNAVKGEPKHILEYGCGTGRNLRFFNRLFPSSTVAGCDISPKSVELAQKTNPKSKLFLIGEETAEDLNKYDLIFVAGVFHHIAPPLRTEAMKNIFRLTASGGKLFFFEHNPYNPVTRHMVNTCEFDTDAVLLKSGELQRLCRDAGFQVREKKYTLFFPAFLKAFRPLEQYLGFLPMGGQYYIQAAKS